MKMAIAAAALTLVASGAFAQNSARNEAACMNDAMTYCSAYVPDEGRIAACLQQNRARISPACQAAIGGAPTARKASTKASSKSAKKRARRAPS